MKRTRTPFIPMPSFTPWWNKPTPKMRMMFGFKMGELKAHRDYLEQRKRTLPGKQSDHTLKQSITFHFPAGRHQYRKDTGEFWKDMLPGDCEDQCLWLLRKLWEGGDIIDNLYLCICETETGEWHCVLILKDRDQDLVIDFRKTDPLIPLGSSVFKGYKFQYISDPYHNEWFTCIKRKVER